jgi:hypothetical protein
MIAIIATLIQVIVLSLVLIGCTTGPFSKLSTGASMRVEVEVYKGPLSKDREVQLGEIFGVIREAKAGLRAFRTGAYTYSQKIGCLIENKSDDCKALEGAIGSADDLLDRTVELEKKAAELRAYDYGQADDEARKNELLSYTKDVSALAIQFKAKAFFWAEYQIKIISADEKVRTKLTEFTTITSEFSNQLASRTTVLQKQFAGKDIKGYNLAVSDHLREASPTAFLHLFDWYRATYSKSKARSGMSAADRVRLAQQLFSDHYWTKINEVHASGQGDVSMALIKDDIGNWNLKSFKNNPTELLNAYRKLSLAGIQAAVDVAGKIAKGSVPGAGALELAGQFAQGRVGSTRTALASSDNINSLHARVLADLNRLKLRTRRDGPALIQAVEDARVSAEAAHDKFEKTMATYQKAEDEVDAKEQSILSTQQEIIAQGSEIDQTQHELELVEQRVKILSPDVDPSLEEHKEELGEKKKQQMETRNETKINLEQLANELKKLEEKEKSTGLELDGAKNESMAASAKFADAEEKLQNFVSEIMQEARKIMEIHRRVILALKETQASSSGPKRLGEPGLKSSTNLPISADLPKIK